MNQLSISNIGFDNNEILAYAKKFHDIGIQGIEIAPTKIWGVLDKSKYKLVKQLRQNLHDLGVQVSGIQSLFYGLPEFQILNRRSWPEIYRHLVLIFEISELLEAKILVFGSPKNRLRAELCETDADQIAASFFRGLEPYLESYGLRIALEPNAREYGADYLITYTDVIRLEKLISSKHIGVQIDTGCLSLAQVNSAESIQLRDPIHVHISAPNLVSPSSASIDFAEIQKALTSIHFSGWTVLEVLEFADDQSVSILDSAQWFVDTFKVRTTEK